MYLQNHKKVIQEYFDEELTYCLDESDYRLLMLEVRRHKKHYVHLLEYFEHKLEQKADELRQWKLEEEAKKEGLDPADLIGPVTLM